MCRGLKQHIKPCMNNLEDEPVHILYVHLDHPVVCGSLSSHVSRVHRVYYIRFYTIKFVPPKGAPAATTQLARYRPPRAEARLMCAQYNC